MLVAGGSLSAAHLLGGSVSAQVGPVAAKGEPTDWETLSAQVEGRLFSPEWPLADCLADPTGATCRNFFEAARNPYYLGDNPALTQTLGWVDAWVSEPSERVLEALSASDVAAAIRFARARDIRLVVKGGGHSYKGGSSADGSLLVWTRRMNQIALHDGFVPLDSTAAPVPAVTIGAGAMWGDVYRQVCVDAGRYVQGGGCLTVGVAGLVQSGGFGSLSKAFGTAAASLLEAEIVTADGQVRIVNTARDPELFFALRGGGGGSFGVVTQVTLRTHDMPKTIGVVFADISARSDAAYRALIARMLEFYADHLFNPHWGEQVAVRPDNVLRIFMMCQGVEQAEAEAIWAPFWAWLEARKTDYDIGEPMVLVFEGRRLWDPSFLRTLPGIVMSDDQAAGDQDRIYWASNREESGQFLHGYESVWVPAGALQPAAREALVAGLFEGSRQWTIALHTNKGLAGAPDAVQEEVVSATATNPVVADSFALAICGADGGPAYPGVAGFEPDIVLAREQAKRIGGAMAALKLRTRANGAYVAESNYFEVYWQEAFWGGNYARLQAAKTRYDPDDIFRTHHGVVPAGR